MKTLLILLLALLVGACDRAAAPVDTQVVAPLAATEADPADAAPPSVRIDADMAGRLGLDQAIAGPGTLAESLVLYGRISANPETVREVHARFPGVVRSVRKALGDEVRSGEPLAIVESDLSLENYTVSAPLSGVITARTANSGQKTGDAPLFVITNVDTVWAALSVFPRDRAAIRSGQPVRLRAADGGATTQQASIARIDLLGTANQALKAHVPLDNRARAFPPGLFVTAEVTVGATPVAVRVPRTAIQDLDGASVVFVVDGDRYTPRPVRLGRQDREQVEVLDGLAAGTPVVAAGSYVIKAELEKSGAEHGH
ncbi:MAG: efflux RND transporter periplasmic adaptor subunit [Gammaproteobacteria bacterium]|nr:efflux RND transporter periplasmic adaptor subunit [Gammaproteobacteria bacterium]